MSFAVDRTANWSGGNNGYIQCDKQFGLPCSSSCYYSVNGAALCSGSQTAGTSWNIANNGNAACASIGRTCIQSWNLSGHFMNCNNSTDIGGALCGATVTAGISWTPANTGNAACASIGRTCLSAYPYNNGFNPSCSKPYNIVGVALCGSSINKANTWPSTSYNYGDSACQSIGESCLQSFCSNCAGQMPDYINYCPSFYQYQGGAALCDTSSPIVSLFVSPGTVVSDNPATISWSSKNVNSCTASSSPNDVNWSGEIATSGSINTSNLTRSTVYAINCTGPNGSATDSKTIAVVLVDPDVLTTKSYSWSTQSNPILAYHYSYCSSKYADTGWAYGLAQNANINVTYNVGVQNSDTGMPLNDNSSVACGTNVTFQFKPNNPSDVSWVGTGYSSDSPYGEWGFDVPPSVC